MKTLTYVREGVNNKKKMLDSENILGWGVIPVR